MIQGSSQADNLSTSSKTRDVKPSGNVANGGRNTAGVNSRRRQSRQQSSSNNNLVDEGNSE
jgi:hypothetical protein